MDDAGDNSGAIFVSYARTDLEIASELVIQLRENGHQVWWDQELPRGGDFRDEVMNAAEHAPAIVVIWSENSVRSRWVIEEALLGLNRNVLLPLLLGSPAIPAGLGAMQALAIPPEPNERGRFWNHFSANLRNVVAERSNARRRQGLDIDLSNYNRISLLRIFASSIVFAFFTSLYCLVSNYGLGDTYASSVTTTITAFGWAFFTRQFMASSKMRLFIRPEPFLSPKMVTAFCILLFFSAISIVFSDQFKLLNLTTKTATDPQSYLSMVSNGLPGAFIASLLVSPLLVQFAAGCRNIWRFYKRVRAKTGGKDVTEYTLISHGEEERNFGNRASKGWQRFREPRLSQLTLSGDDIGSIPTVLTPRDSCLKMGMGIGSRNKYRLLLLRTSRHGLTSIRKELIISAGAGVLCLLGLVALRIVPTTSYLDEARLIAGEEFDDCGHTGWCPSMVVVPPGRFLMGSQLSELGHKASEEPQHQVEIWGLAVSRFVITNSQYLLCSKDGWCGGNGGHSADGASDPALMDFFDATLYVRWLSHRTGHHYRLLSEAEWEYVARAGTTTAWFWGNNPDDACKFGNVADLQLRKNATSRTDTVDCDDHFEQIAPVGRYEPNKFGLYDMAGNVQQWVEDCWSENYLFANEDGLPLTVRFGLPSNGYLTVDCSRRVIRGGSWHRSPLEGRSAYRDADSIDLDGFVGLRVARDLLAWPGH